MVAIATFLPTAAYATTGTVSISSASYIIPVSAINAVISGTGSIGTGDSAERLLYGLLQTLWTRNQAGTAGQPQLGCEVANKNITKGVWEATTNNFSQVNLINHLIVYCDLTDLAKAAVDEGGALRDGNLARRALVLVDAFTKQIYAVGDKGAAYQAVALRRAVAAANGSVNSAHGFRSMDLAVADLPEQILKTVRKRLRANASGNDPSAKYNFPLKAGDMVRVTMTALHPKMAAAKKAHTLKSSHGPRGDVVKVDQAAGGDRDKHVREFQDPEALTAWKQKTEQWRAQRAA
ncbi:hypothetical protein JKP88DRAFT_287670 [Tribonema minus]|uniref:Uncharacterized protein n=1 Tax=Tribonema minus TaxID=303371 RepID=A0A836CJY1_9STRA|nr:hypothetical protein JKP88DRAFT_287670 [Tribonema minus]